MQLRPAVKVHFISVVPRLLVSHRGLTAFVPAAPGHVGPGVHRHAPGDAVEPARDRLAASHRAGPARQDEERRLERILGVVRVAQDLAADAQHHRPMPLDQGRESGFGPVIAPVHIPFQELRVGQVPEHPHAVECLQVSEARRARRTVRHQFGPHRDVATWSAAGRPRYCTISGNLPGEPRAFPRSSRKTTLPPTSKWRTGACINVCEVSIFVKAHP